MPDSQIAGSLAAFEEYELVELMALRESDEVTANQAFTELEKRYREMMYTAIARICGQMSQNPGLVSTLYTNTYITAYRYANSFSMEEGISKEARYKKTFAWLLSIAKLELKSMFSDKEKKNELRLLFPQPGDRDKEEDLFSMMRSNPSSSRQLHFKEEIVAKAIGQIPKERDREIFQTYWLFYTSNPGKSKKLPDNVSAILASEYNTTKENVRQIISRCMKLVRKYLEENYKH